MNCWCSKWISSLTNTSKLPYIFCAALVEKLLFDIIIDRLHFFTIFDSGPKLNPSEPYPLPLLTAARSNLEQCVFLTKRQWSQPCPAKL